MDGATPPVKAFNCPECGASIPVRGVGQTMTAACGSCGSVIDITDPSYRIIDRFLKESKKSWIPLGTRCSFFGVEYEVLGFMTRSDAQETITWDEYLLINPYRGFAWLVCVEGHWSFVRSRKDITADPTAQTVYYDGELFSRYLVDRALVQTVVGEFYWQVRRRDVAKTTDFISPPFILSCEESKDETVWSHGVYLTGAELQAGLNTTKTPPTPKGVAPHQPNPWRNTRALSLAVFFPACLLSLIVHFLCSPSVTEKVLEQSFLYTPLAPAVEVTSKNFTVSKEKTTLALDLSAPVDNSWLAFDIDLLNLSQNSSVSQAAELAYYHGYDDGYWSEGSTTERYYFTNISPGSYALTIAATGDQKRANSLTYTATVTQGAFPRQNLFLALFALALGPICAVFGYYRFEGRRWGQSSTVDGKEDGSEALTNEE